MFEITIELIIEVAEIGKLIGLDIMVVIIDGPPLINEDIVDVTMELGVGATLEVTAELILEAEISGELLEMMSEVV